MKNILTLAQLISKVENNPEIKACRFLTDGYFHELHEDIQSVVREAEEVLIKREGCNWDNIEDLKEEGYDVAPEEKYLMYYNPGCMYPEYNQGSIYTNKGIIVYG